MAALLKFDRNAAVVLTAALFVTQILIRFQSDITHDTAWYLYVAQGLLDGKTLYRDFVEVNPPLAMWLTVAVPLISNASGIAPIPVTYGLFFGVTLVSLLLASRYLRLSNWLPDPARYVFLVVLAGLALFVPGQDFAQREHLMLLLFLPWIFLRIARAKGATIGLLEALAVGAAAAIGVCFKPHAALAPILVEAVFLFVTGQWRLTAAPENLAAAAVAVAYGVAIEIFAPVFLSEIVKLGMAAYVPFYGLSAQAIFMTSIKTLAALCLSAALIFFVPVGQRLVPLTLLAASAGFMIAYALQAKGFVYQLMPAKLLVCACAVSVCVTLANVKLVSCRLLVIYAITAAVILAAVGPQSYPYQGRAFERAIDRYAPAARSVFIASTNIYQAFPLVLHRNLVWGSRLPLQWLVPYVASKWNGGTLPDDDIVRRALDWNVSDLANYKPDIVFVNVSHEQSYLPDHHFDFLGFWMSDPRFPSIWQHYELRATEGDYAIYTRKAD